MKLRSDSDGSDHVGPLRSLLLIMKRLADRQLVYFLLNYWPVPRPPAVENLAASLAKVRRSTATLPYNPTAAAALRRNSEPSRM